MIIITIAHQKGGVGKTTLTLKLAYYLADSLRVAIADTDPQASILDLADLLTGLRIVDLDSTLARKVEGVDGVSVDTPPYLSSRLTKLFEASDYVLVPTKAGILAAVAIRATMALLKQSMVKRPDLKAGIILSMVAPNSSASEDVRGMLASHGIPILQTVITHRVSYGRSPLPVALSARPIRKQRPRLAAWPAKALTPSNRNLMAKQKDKDQYRDKVNQFAQALNDRQPITPIQ